MSRFILSWPLKGLWPNDRVHRMARARAVKAYRNEAWGAALGAGWHLLPEKPALIRLTFCPKPKGPRPDDDNATAAFKAARDGIADALRVNDRDLTFRIEFGERCQHGAVIVEIDPEHTEPLP